MNNIQSSTFLTMDLVFSPEVLPHRQHIAFERRWPSLPKCSNRLLSLRYVKSTNLWSPESPVSTAPWATLHTSHLPLMNYAG